MKASLKVLFRSCCLFSSKAPVVQSFRVVGGAIALFLALAPMPTWGQRIQFPSPVDATAPATVAAPPVITYPSPSQAVPAPATPYPAPSTVFAPPAATYPAPATIPNNFAPGSPLRPAAAMPGQPSVSAGAVPTYPPPAGPAYGPGISPGPTTTFQGTVQPPPATWDPYATPGAQSPALFPQDPFSSAAPGATTGGFASVTKFFQEFHVRDYWIPGNSAKELGLNDSEIAGTFAFPFLYNEQSPLLVTPGVGYQAWNGPKSSPADLPPGTYDAFLEAGWNPQPTPWLGGELALRVGVYTDFSSVNFDSIRFMGRGLMVLTFSPTLQIKGGIVYLDRVRIKLLPAGGVVWTPNGDVRFAIIFPDPKLSSRLTTIGNTEWWWYVRGEYGGGSWTVHRETLDIFEQVDYNDIRAAVGLDWTMLRGWGGFFEAGVAFAREVVYKSSGTPTFKPDPMVFLGAGVSF